MVRRSTYQLLVATVLLAVLLPGTTRLRAAEALSTSAPTSNPTTRPVRPASGEPDARFAALDQAVVAFADLVDAGAVTVAVNVDGRQVYSRGFGWRDKDRREPVTPTALMRVASVSKPITAAIVKDLFRQRKLTPDTKAFGYLGLTPPPGTELDPRLADITIGHLLQHKGGWDRGAAFDPMFRTRDVEKTLGLTQPATAGDVIRIHAGQAAAVAPGEKSVYSNFGYCVLGRVIEKATGQTYEAVLKHTITEPLKIADLKVGRNSSKQRDPAEVYYPVRDDAFSLDIMDAHGGIIASAPRYADSCRPTGSAANPGRQGRRGRSGFSSEAFRAPRQWSCSATGWM